MGCILIRYVLMNLIFSICILEIMFIILLKTDGDALVQNVNCFGHFYFHFRLIVHNRVGQSCNRVHITKSYHKWQCRVDKLFNHHLVMQAGLRVGQHPDKFQARNCLCRI
jgi:hypothetical protein